MYQMGMSGKKWDIFWESLKLFAKSGYHNVSIKQIAGAAKINTGSIYYYFESKEDILNTIFAFNERYYQEPMYTLEELLAFSETHSVFETLMYTLVRYEPELQPVMDNILIVAMTLPDDPRTQDLIKRNYEDICWLNLEPLLTHLSKAGRIAPIDIEAFINGVICICYRMAITNIKRESPDTTNLYERTMSLLFESIHEVMPPNLTGVKPQKGKGN